MKAEETVEVPLALFEFISIRIGNPGVVWDFSDINSNPQNPDFPPASFPEYYGPTDPPGSPHQRIRVIVWGFGPGGQQAGNWVITVEGGGDPDPPCGILLQDIQYSTAGSSNWLSFSESSDTLLTGSGNIRDNIDINYRVKIDGDESSTISSSTIIIYTVQPY